jgi:DNA polymerase
VPSAANTQSEPDEVEQCEPFLFGQIETIKRRSSSRSASSRRSRAEDRLSHHPDQGPRVQVPGRDLMPTYHPAYLLRNPSSKREVWEDMKRVRAILTQE